MPLKEFITYNSQEKAEATPLRPQRSTRFGRRQKQRAEKAMAPPPVLLPGKSHGRRSLVGYRLWGHKESDTTQRLDFHFHFLTDTVSIVEAVASRSPQGWAVGSNCETCLGVEQS